MKNEKPALLLVSIAALLGCGGGSYDNQYDDLGAALREARRPAVEADAPLFQGEGPLERAALVEAVLARNPSVEAARQGWAAALAGYDQATSLDDPMASYMFAPLTISGDARYGQVIQVSQRFPFPGTLRLRGAVALAEAQAAEGDYEATLLELALAASLLYDDYYAVARALEINEEHQELLEELKESAVAQYEVGRAAQQDPLKAEVELAHVQHERVVLGAERAVIIARLNGLLHRPPEAPLPPPPAELEVPDALTLELDALVATALEQRPDLDAVAARIQAAAASAELADKAYYPDFEIMGQYSSMWEMPDHRWMAGVGLSIPLWRGRRAAAVDQAEARVAAARSQREALEAVIRADVAAALERVREAHHVVQLFGSTVLPASIDQAEAARAGFIADQNQFLDVIDAERNLRRVELDYQRALAQLQRRLAELERAVGRVPGLGDDLATGGPAPRSGPRGDAP